MPKKLRRLLQDLANAGYVDRGGGGSHRNYEHPCGTRLTVSVYSGEAKKYQQNDIEVAIAAAISWKMKQESDEIRNDERRKG
ncbi:MAG: type II toxin-antitoxin system HicA family toxin [Opitutaceae bacterium]